MHPDLSLDGRTALVTGVSRRRGIGFAVARRLSEMGASLAVHHHLAHDLAEYGNTDDIETLVEDLRKAGPSHVIALAGDLPSRRPAGTSLRRRRTSLGISTS